MTSLVDAARKALSRGEQEPALPFRIDAMQLADIPYVMAIERRVFSMAWTSGIYQRELTANPWSHYRVIRSLGHGRPPLLAYGGVWQMGDTAHIPTLATHPDYMGKHLGGFLLIDLLTLAYELGCIEATLEVRESNTRAQALYRRRHFEVVGKRRRYYHNNQENALIMTRPTLDYLEIMQERAEEELAIRRIWLPAAQE